MANIIEMPKLSDTMTTGTLVKWLKKEGDVVKSGTMLAEVETDKATMELESFFDGTILKIFAAPGAQVALGAPLCAIGKPGETVDVPTPPTSQPPLAKDAAPAPVDKKAAPVPEGGPPPPQSVASNNTPQSAAPASGPAPVVDRPEGGDNARVKISPLARKLATEKKIEISRLKGSGPGGRIVREDVLAAEKNGTAAPAAKTGNFAGGAISRTGPIQEERTIPVSNMRGIIAKRLLESKTSIPHFYLEVEIDAGPVMELRAQLNTALEKDGVKLSVNDFVLKASAQALRRVPNVNCAWENTQVRYFAAAHVSFAVAIEDGLITPVIRDTHTKSIFAISTEVKALAKKARDKKLVPAEFSGGTFCVSNLGMMGVDRFSAIINPPNSAILAVGATVKKPVVRGDEIVVGQRMSLTLSVDHRVVDGALGATFLAALKDLMEKPALLLI